jgi:DNA invertase Pin-like site-specific DNA recombinase
MDTPALIEGYTRKSRALGDPDDPHLLAHHLAKLREVAARDGITLAHIHTEIGSGETIEDRPVFSQRLAYWERLPQGIGGLIYVTEVARLSRGEPADTGRIVAAFSRASLRVRTPERTYNLSSPDDLLMFMILSAVSHHSLGINKQLVQNKREQTNREGLPTTGTVPLGYTWDRKLKKVVATDQYPLVVELCRRVQRESLARLSADSGIPVGTLRNMFKSPILCGRTALRYAPYPDRLRRDGRPRVQKYRRLPLEEWVWGEAEGDWPKACTWEEWLLIQERIGDRKKRHGRIEHAQEGWCRNLLVFVGEEGYVRLGGGGSEGRRCLTYDLLREGGPRLSVPRDLVHQAAAAALSSLVEAPGFLARGAAEQEAWLREEAASGPPTRARDALRRQVARERATLSALTEQAAAGDAEDRLANQEARERVKERLEGLKRELAALDRRPAPELAAALPHLANLRGQFALRWPGLPGVVKRRLAELLLEAVEVEVTPRPKPQAWHREVVAVRVRPEWAGRG